MLQPSAAIFDITMLVTGAMILAGAWFAYRALRSKAVLVPTALLGVGTLGVGAFPLTHPAPHTLFAFTAFLAGGIAVVLSSRVTTAPFRYIWMLLGTVCAGRDRARPGRLPHWAPMVELGEGGIERWIVYPIVLWLVAFGSYLMATPATRAPHDGSRSVEERTSIDSGMRRGPGHTGTFGPAAARTSTVRSA